MSFSLITAESGVKYLRSSLLVNPHGFATRLGGVSRADHTASLNLAFGRGDADETVLENLRLFSEAVGIDPHSVISRPQIHSADVVTVSSSMAGEGSYTKTDAGCDGYVTDCDGVSLGVKTADCVPILFEDPEAHIIGAVHAGWRGTVSRIAAECVKGMCALGADVSNIRAAVGPAIHFCCYEVGEDFYASVRSAAGEDIANSFIRTEGGKLHADIVGMNRHFLLEAGLREENIDICELCTCHNPDLFFSHRYSRGLRGTMLSVISL